MRSIRLRSLVIWDLILAALYKNPHDIPDD